MSEKSYELICKVFAEVLRELKTNWNRYLKGSSCDIPVGTSVILKGSS